MLLQLSAAAPAAAITVLGPGREVFTSGDAALSQNVLHIIRKDTAGAMQPLSAHMIRLRVSRPAAAGADLGMYSVHFDADGTARVVYNVRDATLPEVALQLAVNGSYVWEGVARRWGINGRHIGSHSISPGRTFGIAVSPNRLHLVVSFYDEHVLRVYKLLPTFELVRKLGSTAGAGLGQFKQPFKLCFAPAEHILVTEWENNRVQEVTLAGVHVRSFHVVHACAVALHGDLMAVGTLRATLHILR